jgi:glyoxylase I family protein
MATITGAHHIAFTVRNAEASAQWYQDLLGMQVLIAHEDETVKLRVLAHPDSGWIIGIRQYVGREEAEFTEFRTGLDHFAFTVGSRDDLTQWEAELSRRDIPFTPTADTPIGTVVVFRDPDNIQLEFWLPIGQ